ncbi:MAG: aldo/keto reductase [Candidatus Aminicenantales bacterium]
MMRKKQFSRRDFLKTCLATTAAAGGLSSRPVFAGSHRGQIASPYDPKSLPTRVLGKTGISIPLISFGSGSRFCRIHDPEKSVEALDYALDHGLYHWDTAHDYVFEGVNSEERLGLVLKGRRPEVFLSTKVAERTFDGAMRHLEESLNRLQTDRLDIYQVHMVESLEDVDKIGAKGGVLEALHKLKDEKVTRFIGFSGHLSAEAMKAAAERYEFDTMLIALNHHTEAKGDMEKGAIPAAAAKGLGVMVIKVIRPRETVEGIVSEDLIRYALTLKHVTSAAVGHDSLDVLKKNIAMLRDFKEMSASEMAAMSARLEPFFRGNALPWMRPGYRDGLCA